MTNQSVSPSDNLVRDALQTWNTSIVESGNDFNRMKSTLTAIMPQIVQQSDIETAALAAAKTNQLRQNRRYKKLLRRCSQLNNALIKAKASKPDNMAAVREECAKAVENAVLSYNLTDCAGLSDWAAFEKGQESGLKAGAAAIRALSAEPTQGEQWRDMEALAALSKLTFAIQHNPNCPHKFLIRLVGKSGFIDLKPYRDQLGTRLHETGDIIGSGKTLYEAYIAATAALKPETEA